jgi:type IV secretory pathway TrbL component
MQRSMNVFLAALLLGLIGTPVSAQTGTAMDGNAGKKFQSRSSDSSRSANGEKLGGGTRGVTSGGSGNDENSASGSTTGNSGATVPHQHEGATSDRVAHRKKQDSANTKVQSKATPPGTASTSTTGTTSVPGSSISGDDQKK